MKFSRNISNQRRKGRISTLSADSNTKRKQMSSPLSPEVQKEQNIQTLPVVKGDTVMITRGSHRGTSGKVTAVYRLRNSLKIEKIQRQSKKGALSYIPIKASNVVITKLVTSKDRTNLINRKKEGRGLDKGKYTKQEVSN